MLQVDPLSLFYLSCLAAGALLLVVRVVLMIAGMGHGADAGGDGPDDISAGHDVAAHAGDPSGHEVPHHSAGESDASFKLLTLQGIMGFLIMFGLTGYTVRAIAGGLVSVAAGIVVGIASMWLMAKLFSLLMNLQSSGTIEMHNAVWQEGTVYLTIPPDGVGKVQVVVQGRLQEFEAVSDGKTELKPGDRVIVVHCKGSTLVVHKT
ncbi:MAG: hypothetical protein JXA20_20590 [Spirochaetes bacterium]|nr:hypothetical protein [Spirochaetota bacterium]